MKKIFILFLLLSLFGFSSCKNNEINTLNMIASHTNYDITSTINAITTGVVNKNIWVSPEATIGLGTINNPTNLIDAIDRIEDGYTIYMISGQYNFSNTITIANSGTENGYKTIMPYFGPVYFDFSNSNGVGLQLDGSFWKIMNINICNAKSNGICITGNNNIIELCDIYKNGDSGLAITRYDDNSTIENWPKGNQILNCTAYHNSINTDPLANGFEAKIVGDGNVFDGCVAYQNVNNGFDFENKSNIGIIGAITIKNCVSLNNGVDYNLKETTSSPGNGYKLGGSGGAVLHQVTNCIAAFNKGHGFTDGGNAGPITYKNCTGYGNGYEGNKKSNFYSLKTSVSRHIYINVLSYSNSTEMDGDKIYGEVSYSLLYMSKKYYYVGDEQTVYSSTSSTRGLELNSKIITAEAIFEEYEVFDYNIIHENRNVDGTINLNGFLNVRSDFKYATNEENDLGSKF